MCFDHDSRPPIAPIAGGALDSERLVLTADDGNRLNPRQLAGSATGRSRPYLARPVQNEVHPRAKGRAIRYRLR